MSVLSPHRLDGLKNCKNEGSRTLNSFESGLKLGDEPLYILNRKKQNVSWLGLSLPRPSLIAVPVEVWLRFISMLVCMHYRGHHL